MDDKSWVIHGLVVETGDWFSGEEILIPQVKKLVRTQVASSVLAERLPAM